MTHASTFPGGTVAWFTPGTVHRAVNDGDLRVLVLMANSGLPEAGDAVMTFPPEHLVDLATYRARAQPPERATEAERQADADRRRDLAVQGFLELANGDWSSLLASGVFEADADPGEQRFGMCGRLSTYRLGA